MLDLLGNLFGALEAAIYETVHGFRLPGSKERGAVALAPRCGMNPGTLSNKANPEMPSHSMGLVESVPLQLVANDFRILYAYNAALRHCAYAMPESNDASDVELLDLYCAIHEKGGLKARAIREAMRDGRFTHKEVTDLRALFDDEIRAGLEFFSRVEALAQ